MQWYDRTTIVGLLLKPGNKYRGRSHYRSMHGHAAMAREDLKFLHQVCPYSAGFSDYTPEHWSIFFSTTSVISALIKYSVYTGMTTVYAVQFDSQRNLQLTVFCSTCYLLCFVFVRDTLSRFRGNAQKSPSFIFTLTTSSICSFIRFCVNVCCWNTSKNHVLTMLFACSLFQRYVGKS